MRDKIILFLLTLCMASIIVFIFPKIVLNAQNTVEPSFPVQEETIPPETAPPVIILCPDIIYHRYETKDAAAEYLNKVSYWINLIEQQPPHPEMAKELIRLRKIQFALETDIERFEEYPEATFVWQSLLNDGFSREAAAGILGNMMTECGGRNGKLLGLKPEAYNPYEHGGGLCGWLYQYYPTAQGATLEQQYELLMNTIQRQFSRHGNLYKKGFTYEDFITMTDPEQAALAFAKIYERCASYTYSRRMERANIAYMYYAAGQN